MLCQVLYAGNGVHLFLYFALLRHSSQLKQGEYQFVLHYCWKFGRILLNCNMWFGCCHNGGRFSPQCTFFKFRTRVRVIFLIWKSPQSYTERGMTLMTFELTFSDLCQLALVIIALIELFRKREHKKRWAALPKEPAHLFESNWGLTVHRQHSFYLQLYSVFIRCQGLYAGRDRTFPLPKERLISHTWRQGPCGVFR